MGITQESFGRTRDGQPVEAFILENAKGVKVKVINYGAAIVSVLAPDRSGRLADVVLGFDRIEGYQGDNNPHIGCCCGRYANRIANGRFTLDGVEYQLAVNNGPNSLHGGLAGFDKKVWDAEISGDTVCMSLISEDGDEGYPGTLQVKLVYSLNTDGELRIDYIAITDRKTVINLTNHSYFNLAGGGTIRHHVIRINADTYTVVNGNMIPTGELRPVAGTEMDLRIPTPINRNIDAVEGLGYDHNYCINQVKEGDLTLAVQVTEPESGRKLECWTTEPGVQFYTGNFLNGVQGKGGAYYNKQEGFCLETQHYPNSPNQPDFPSAVLEPGQTYTQTCIYKFDVAR
jgi:aldose 1-epimerase